jgi:hypothetical protein
MGTLTIRLSDEDRGTLAQLAAERGVRGVSALVRELAEDEARRARREQIREEGEAVVAYLAESAQARTELDLLGTPQSEPV